MDAPGRMTEGAGTRLAAQPRGVAMDGHAGALVPELVAQAYAAAPAPLRSRLVECLLGALGPLALAALCDGRFARFLLRSPSGPPFVTTEDIASISQSHVLTLGQYVSEACPATFASVAEILQAEQPMLLSTLSAGALAFLIRAWLGSRRR